MEQAKVGDTLIYYRTTGEGHPLVMIMGLTATLDWWDPSFLERLSERYELLVFDNRGAGRTEAPPGDVTIPLMATDTAGLMDAVGFERAHVLGISMGGMIAQQLALDYPGKVDRLVLCATFCGGQETVYAEREVLMKMLDRSGTPEQRVRRTTSLLFPDEWLEENPDYFEDFLERFSIAPTTEENAARQFMATVQFNTYDRLPEIENPTLVACGTEDVIIPPENSKILAQRIPDARLVEFEGAGHGFTQQCQGELFEVLTDFLG